MTPNDLHQQLWNDALDDVATEAIDGPLWLHTRQGVRSQRRRRVWIRVAMTAAALLVAASAWRGFSGHKPEMVRAPEPVPQNRVEAPVPPGVISPAPSPSPPVTPQHLVEAPVPPVPAPEAPTPETPAPKHVVIQSVALHDFLAQLPHHGYVEISNARGRFLVVVDHETGEAFTTVLSKDDQL